MEVREAIGYPTAAYEEGIEGQVFAKILIGPEGEYVRHEITNQTMYCSKTPLWNI